MSWRSAVRRIRAQIPAYAAAWDEANSRDRDCAGPLWVVLGDSSAQGVGADSYDGGYVGQLRTLLDRAAPVPWRVRNLSRSGARASDVLTDQLPQLGGLPGGPALVTCAVGGNDLLRTRAPALVAQLRAIMAQLPPGAVLATLPQGLAVRKARRISELVRTEAPHVGLRVADLWAHTGRPWRGKYNGDYFHPTAVGYADWVRAFAEALELHPSDGQPADE
jgi:acyl-CoA thioesterase I